ncbi:unnamed protein product [Microthlaspi erraticum]|uniref:GOLD domain-containing protein n=1 Tax=Microthlaspi erraticum TaxID=1685480 RepID=A0A6D2KGJ7_9BRAS|nr:unnamed protein product [Microthlaspi erraticum]
MAKASSVFQSTLIPSFSPLHQLRSQNFVLSYPPLPASRCRPGIHCSVSAGETTRRSVEEEVPDISWGCEIDSVENATSLQKWLSDSGLPPQKMSIDRVDVGERGLVASQNLRKGEKLLFVPPSLVISADSKWTDAEAGEVMKRYDVPDWPLLATYLISEASLKNSSRWFNYISALPRQPYSLLYWTRTELDMYLEASQIRERAIERITNVVGTYEDLRSRIFSKHPQLFPKEVFNDETFKWSFGILFSRLVRLPSMDGRFALVPWADMLNHNCEVETYLDYDKSSKGVVFTADRPYQPGEQVFISYGNKSNGELLLSYGFVPREGTNPSDSVELALSLRKTDECYKEKLDALKKHGLSTPQCFPVRITGWPMELMAYAYLVVSPPNMRNSFEEMAKAASNKSSTKKDLSYPEIEEEALQFILDSCETSISKFSRFLKESGSMDLDITSPKQLNRKAFLKQLAVDLSTSERRILYRAQYILRRRLRDIRSGELKALRLFSGLRNFFSLKLFVSNSERILSLSPLFLAQFLFFSDFLNTHQPERIFIDLSITRLILSTQFPDLEDELEGCDPNIRARDTLHVSFVVIKSDSQWHFNEDGVDLVIHGPTGEQIHDFREQISAKHDFVVQKKGVYRFCFTNKSPYHETIDFDVQLGHFAYYDQHAKDEHFTPLMEQISKLEEALYNIQFEQHWLEAQTDRQAIVNENMSKRAVHKALFESFALIGASVLQVYLLCRLFERKLGMSRV